MIGNGRLSEFFVLITIRRLVKGEAKNATATKQQKSPENDISV